MKKCTKSLLGIALVAGLTFVAPTAVFAEGSDVNPNNLPVYDLPTREEAVREKYSFYSNDELVSEQYIVSGDFLYEPEAQVLDGQVFVGWFDEEGNQIDFWTANEVVESREVKVTARYEEAGIVAHFVQEINGEEVVIESKVAEDGKVSLDVDVDLKIDEYLEGWDDNGTILKAGQEVTISESKTLKAVIGQKVWVNFKTGEKATKISPVAVIPGSTVQKPTNPTREGWDFVEWQLDGARYDFSKTVNSEITLTAKWAPAVAPYTIVVRRENTEGEMKAVKVILDREAESGSEVTVDVLNDSDITFSDIDYYEPTETSVSATVEGDGSTIIIVEFKRKEYTFEFDFGSNSGIGALYGNRTVTDGAGTQHSGSPYTITAKIGDDVSEIWATTVNNLRNLLGGRERFYAWRATNLSGQPLVGGNIRTITPELLSKTDTTITLELVLAGIFDRNPYQSQLRPWTPAREVDEPTVQEPEEVYYTVTLDLDGGETSSETQESVKEGELATNPENPTKDGFTFGGWKNAENDEAFDFGKNAIIVDTTVKATWIPNKDIIRVCYVNGDDSEEYDELLYTENGIVVAKEYTGSYPEDFVAFVGWQVSSGNRSAINPDSHYGPFGTLFQPNGLIEVADYANGGVLKLVAALDYEEPTAYIYYYANDGTEDYAYYDGLKRNLDYEILDSEFSREGFRFVGWNTMEDGSGQTYLPGEFLALDSYSFGNELYAMWEEIVEEPEEVVSEEFENPVTYDGISLYVMTFVFATILAGGIMFSKRVA